jgi:virulence-associated protein VagC
MKRAKLFKIGQRTVVSLPKEFGLNEDEVDIKRTDEGVLLVPLKQAWVPFLNNLDQFSDDFMAEPDQQSIDA